MFYTKGCKFRHVFQNFHQNHGAHRETPAVTASPCHLPLGGRLLPYHHIKAPSQRELSPKVTEGVTQNIPASVPFSSIPAFQGSAVQLPPSRLTPRHLPQGGRLFLGPETFPLCQKAPSQRELSPKVTEGVTQNIPASAPFSSVPTFQGSAVRFAFAYLHISQMI